MRSEIDKTTFCVSIFDTQSDIPFLIQPNYPDGSQFKTIEEAEIWANAFILSHQPDALFYAPNGPDSEVISKPTQNEINEFIISRIQEDPTLLEYADQYLGADFVIPEKPILIDEYK